MTRKLNRFILVMALLGVSLTFANDLESKENRQFLEYFAFTMFCPGISDLRTDGAVTETNILERFGNPNSVKTWKEPDRREPGITNLYKQFEYDGLSITIGGPENSFESWLKMIILKSAKYELIGGLRIGEPVDKFIRLLGPPQYSGYTFIAHTYAVKEGVTFAGHATVKLSVNDEGKVDKISLEYWAD